jgi:hypothetical protein
MCLHLSAHASTCQHISAYVHTVCICTCQHAYCLYESAHACTCQHTSEHMYLHMFLDFYRFFKRILVVKRLRFAPKLEVNCITIFKSKCVLTYSWPNMKYMLHIQSAERKKNHFRFHCSAS